MDDLNNSNVVGNDIDGNTQVEDARNAKSKKILFIILGSFFVFSVICASVLALVYLTEAKKLQTNSVNTLRKKVLMDLGFAVSFYEIEYLSSPNEIKVEGSEIVIDSTGKVSNIPVSQFEKIEVSYSCAEVGAEETNSKNLWLCVDYKKKLMGVRLENSTEGFTQPFNPIYLPDDKSEPTPFPSTIPSVSLNESQVITFANMSVTLPQGYEGKVDMYSQEDLKPNGFCTNTSGQSGTCEILTIKIPNINAHVFLANASDFGYMVTDVQECFKTIDRNVQMGSVNINYVEYYHNIEEIQYIPDANPPYNCELVSISENNFHHLKGCTNQVCVFADKSVGLNEFNSLFEAIDININMRE